MVSDDPRLQGPYKEAAKDAGKGRLQSLVQGKLPYSINVQVALEVMLKIKNTHGSPLDSKE